MLKWTWLSAVIVFFDRLTKWQAEESLVIYQAKEVTSFLNWKLMYNEGAAFSLFANQGGWQRWFFIILAVAVSGFILNWLRTLERDERWTAIGLSLVLGGAIGNLIDRIISGKVVDFIDFHFPLPFINPDYHFATFNIADIGITVGAAILIFISLFSAAKD